MKPMQIIGVCIILLVIPLAYAMPLPRGIDGRIFDKQTLEPAPDGTNFSVCNLATGICALGQTGNHARSGRFSAAITGSDGNPIELRAWAGPYSTNRTIVLNGSMHGINLLLDFGIYPPTIVSSPTNMAAEKPSPSHEYSELQLLSSYRATPSPIVNNSMILITGTIFESPGNPLDGGLLIINNDTGRMVSAQTKGSGSYFAQIPGEDNHTIILQLSDGKQYPFKPGSKDVEFGIMINSIPYKLLALLTLALLMFSTIAAIRFKRKWKK